ncbi:MAG: DedA family protein [Acidobacteria bacterium]|nr:DedA family protein [Acidobacteriota bacterium]
MRAWTESLAGSPHGSAALFAVAFAESSFFPVPPDVLLLALAVARPEHSLWYATVCTAGSVVGGLAGYGIGVAGGRPLLRRLFAPGRIVHAHDMFQRYEGWAVAIAGFTPIPYKLATISAGALRVDFRVFAVASILSRGARFFLEGILIWWFGGAIRSFLDRYFDLLAVVFLVLLLAGFVALRLVAGRTRTRSRLPAGGVTPPGPEGPPSVLDP